MTRDDLANSPVFFNEDEHTYRLNGMLLSGITSIIHRYVFPDMYSGVSQAVLSRAAERGSRIHKNIELLHAGVISEGDAPEIKPFVAATRDIRFIASEYLVSDNSSVASCIDLVAEKDGVIDLYDIKTTAVLNVEYLQWQLSIYAYLFELQNAGLKVSHLGAIHLRGERCVVVPINRLPDEYVESLLNAYRCNAATFINPLHDLPGEMDELLKEYREVETSIAEVNIALSPLAERKAKISERLAEMLREKGLNKVETEQAKITVSSDTVRESFDTKAFRGSEIFAADPEKYAAFFKQSNVKGRVTITLKEAV